jgi:UDP-N-acetylmuramoyl-L-alanyl-D-glutamate--2,6-diaminopimelate ligase
MRLSTLLDALPDELAPTSARPADDPVIRGIAYDSRKVAPGDLFVALVGAVSDGHDFLDAALDLGAVALLVEDEARARDAVAHAGRDLPVVAVPDSRRALAPISARFYGDPADELTLIGITGTNGKTSTSYLVESILARGERATGLIGTVAIRYASESLRAVNTTPESLDLQQVLRAMRTHGVDSVIMEVSSHGLELGRVRGCRFRVGAVTNVTQDHLDFHGDMESYLRSKLRLFEDHLAPGGVAVINVDDPSAERFLAAAHSGGARLIRATRRPGVEAEVALIEADVQLAGTRARLRLPAGELEVVLPLLGDFNLENLVVACGIAAALELPLDVIAEGVAHCPQVPGRMEVVAPHPDAPTVIVDYAHTPDAVEKLIDAVRPLTRGRLITVFGCGGDRDRAKRPLMAQAVAKSSDRIVATSDNPRTEDPQQILRDVEAGLQGRDRVEADELDAREGAYALLVDRREAIELAVSIARADDTVVLAGKGHEDYQIVGRNKLPFDDREEAGRALAEWYRLHRRDADVGAAGSGEGS